MNRLNNIKGTAHKRQEGLFTAISVGFTLLLVGIILVITPNLFDKIITLFKDFTLVDIPNTGIIFPAPEFPSTHLTVYQAAEQFSIAIAILQIVLLLLRFVIPSSWEKRAETVGNFVYWTGAAVLIQLLLIENTQWYTFWSVLIILIGVSLIIRATVMAVSRI